MSFQYPLILDGGFATELERGFHKDLSGKLWSAQCLKDDPQAIKMVHKRYYEAGANIATTCSYQASVEGFMTHGNTYQEAIELMELSVLLAHQAREEFNAENPEKSPRLVALSIGCYGAILANGAEYTGNYGPVDLVEFHEKRLDIYLKHQDKIDFILFETIPSYLEAQAIKSIAMKRKLPPIAVSFQCKSNLEIADGTPLSQAVELFNDVNSIFAIGFNCTKTRYMEGLLDILTTSTKDKVFILYPDGGEEWDAVERTWDSSQKLSEQEFGKMMAQVIKQHVKVIVGGCCGTIPNHIQAIQSYL